MKFNIHDIQISTDSTEVIRLLSESNLQSNIIYECRELLRLMGQPSIQHEPRGGNRVADILAHRGKDLPDAKPFVDWIAAPDFVVGAYDEDRRNVVFDRH